MKAKKVKLRKWLPWGAMFLLVLLAACAQAETSPVAPPPLNVVTPTPLPTVAVGKTVVADGYLAAPYPKLALGFGDGVNGEVLTITVKPGDRLPAGALIAVLDDTELQRAVTDAERALARAQLERTRAEEQRQRDLADAEQALAAAKRSLNTAYLQSSSTAIEEARTTLEQARRDEEYAKSKYDEVYGWGWPPAEMRQQYYDSWQKAKRDRELAELRLKDAEDQEGVRSLDAQTRKDDVAQAERRLAALQTGLDPKLDQAVEDAELQLEKAKRALTHARLTAPWEALVQSVEVAPHATVAAGTPVVTLLSLEDGLRFVTPNLSEQHIATIRPGQPAVVTLRTFIETPLTGTVETIVPQGEAQTGSDARFTVRIQLAPTTLALLPGLTGRVEIFTEQ